MTTRMFGHARYAAVNQTLNDAFSQHGTLVAAHRGTGLGTIAENTLAAVIAASRSGAHIVEIDVIRSADGEYFVFHDGYEPWHFGFEHNIQTLTSADIEGLAYRQRVAPPLVRVDRLETVLRGLPDGVILNVDRSWRYWPELLDRLAEFDITDRLLLKVPADDTHALDAARACGTPFPILGIAHTTASVAGIVGDETLNVVGAELVTASADHPFCDRRWVQGLRDAGTFAYVNALDLGTTDVLFAGWDDTASVLGDPQDGWGRILDLGVDVIQTDWPALLLQYMQRRVPAAAGWPGV